MTKFVQAPDGSWHPKPTMSTGAKMLVALVILAAIGAGVGWAVWNGHRQSERTVDSVCFSLGAC